MIGHLNHIAIAVPDLAAAAAKYRDLLGTATGALHLSLGGEVAVQRRVRGPSPHYRTYP